MTEPDWSGTDPTSMLELLRGKASERKLRLFAVACLRRIRHLFKHEDLLRGLEVAERFAEGRATGEELRTAEELAMWAGDDVSWHSMQEAVAAWAAAAVAEGEGIRAARGAVYEVRQVFSEDNVQCDRERQAQGHLLRDILGNPFCPVLFNAAWRTADVLTLAAASYEERSLPSGELDPVRLAVLADALEESGCADASILDHLRGPGPHVRGCWVIDSLLAKEEQPS